MNALDSVATMAAFSGQIVMVTDSPDPSGLGHHMITLAAALQPQIRPRLAFRASVAAEGFAQKAKVRGIQCSIVPAGLGWKTWLAGASPALVHIHAGIGWEGHEIVRAALELGLPVVRTEHLPWLITDPHQASAYRDMLAGVEALIAVSPSSGASWQAAVGSLLPIDIIANGIELKTGQTERAATRILLGIPQEAPMILHVGRFSAQKDHRTLIEAFAPLTRQHPEAHLVLVGSGETRSEVAAQIARLGRIAVTILDDRDDVAELMAAADLLVLPSLFEGLPLVLLEAMAAGLPVVASRIGGVIEVLGKNHPWLVEPGDAQGLSRALDEALSDKDGRARLSDRQTARLRKDYTADRMADETVRVYQRVAAQHRSIVAPRQEMTIARIGFIGCGGIAQRHLGVLRTFGDVTIAAVADPDLSRAEATAEDYGARAFAGLDEMLAEMPLDAVFICVPPFAHGAAERAAIAVGLPFFVEKPITLDLHLAEQIAQEVHDAGLVTAVGYHWRYLDTVDEARRALADNPAQLMTGFWLDQTPPPAWWHDAKQSGGQIVEQVTHIIDTARYLAGPVTSVYGQSNHRDRAAFLGMTARTATTATLTFASGAIATLAATCLLRWSHRIGLHLFADGLAIELSDQDVTIDTGKGRNPQRAEGDPVWREDRDFIDAVRGLGNRIRTPYADALETHRVALAIMRSIQTGAVVTLPPEVTPVIQPNSPLRRVPAAPHAVRRVRSLGVEAPHRPYFFAYDEGPAEAGQVRLDLMYTGLSAGTELTFLKNTNPYLYSRWDAEAGTFVEGEPSLQYPVPFMGYMEVGRVIDSRAVGYRNGDVVATAFGHKSGHVADASQNLLVPLASNFDPVLGVFVAQMGPIAANGILHADALVHTAGPLRFGTGIAGRRVVVWGGGTVGLLTALFARRAGAASVLIAEPSDCRRDLAARLGIEAVGEHDAWRIAKGWFSGDGDRGADLVFQTRARSESLQLALRSLRPQGTVIDLAFYQGGMDRTRLGEEFHHNGLSLICAQIGRVPARFATDWTRRRLSDETLALLAADGPAIRQHMITHLVPYDDGPAFLTHLITDRPEFLQIVFEYPQ